ncbi:alpha/beta fold hydrolase [Candidatus Micrarchaeota archaeon]|nr:alpha/beta fold hydrolase [Candidatus Micrarchaeota archaeon]
MSDKKKAPQEPIKLTKIEEYLLDNVEKKHLIAVFGLIVLLILFYFLTIPQKVFFIDSNGIAHYLQNRGPIEFTEKSVADDLDYSVSEISFNSNGTRVYGKLWVPKTSGRHAAILFLPGAGGLKEAGIDYANLFKGKNVAIFALDQRGYGQTAGNSQGFDAEYAQFLQGKEYQSVLFAYDALRAFDYLAQRQDIDSSKIAILGESLGGRNAIIAGAMENRFKMVVGISTGGYGLPTANNANASRFIRSIDPDAYIPLISPRKVVIFHSENDNLQPYSIGLRTFNYAGEPKQMVKVYCKSHGLCSDMSGIVVDQIVKELNP